MKMRKLKPHSLSYLFSIFLGVLLLMISILAFMRFAKGNIWVALSLAFISNMILSLFLGWVDVQENASELESESGRQMRRKQS